MKKKKNINSIIKNNFDYEEDYYDKLKYTEVNKVDFYTNKAKMNRVEFDYEEDAYEPIREDD